MLMKQTAISPAQLHIQYLQEIPTPQIQNAKISIILLLLLILSIVSP